MYRLTRISGVGIEERLSVRPVSPRLGMNIRQPACLSLSGSFSEGLVMHVVKRDASLLVQ